MVRRGFNLVVVGALLSLGLVLPGRVQAAKRPAPCYVTLPEIYLVINRTRRHIIDWETFLALGYTQADIVPCGDASTYPEGAPITRLVKGSSVRVYWMQDGMRRHIPDMDTFNWLGFQVKDITVLPDNILALWPEGEPLPTKPQPVAEDGAKLVQTINLGRYTIQRWQRYSTPSWLDYAFISAPKMLSVRLEAVEAISVPSVADITGDGNPDIIFLAHYAGSSHCCWGTVVYDLGATPTKVLDITSPAYQLPSTGRGNFLDLDGDGSYEFVTFDPVAMGCSQPVVQVILRFDPTKRAYVGATPRYPEYYARKLSVLEAEAQARNVYDPGDPCTPVPLVTSLLYLGLPTEARAALDRVYKGPNPDALFTEVKKAAESGRFYAPADSR